MMNTSESVLRPNLISHSIKRKNKKPKNEIRTWAYSI